MNTVVLKVGGALITDKNSEYPLLDKTSLDSIASEIAKAYRKGNFRLVLVNGAGSFGHPFCLKTGIGKGIRNPTDANNFAKDVSLMNELNVLFCNALIDKGLPAVPFQPVPVSVMRGGKLIFLNTGIARNLLSVGCVPSLFGTCAFDSEKGCSILSGDGIVSFIAGKLGAKKVIFATDVDGIHDFDPRIKPDSKIIRSLSRQGLCRVLKNIGGSGSIDATSGMHGKALEILKMRNVECYVVNGRIRGNVGKVLLGKHIGTKIKL